MIILWLSLAAKNLRASRESELLVEFRAKDVVGWIGNSVAVARDSYAMPSDASFERAIQQGVSNQART